MDEGLKAVAKAITDDSKKDRRFAYGVLFVVTFAFVLGGLFTWKIVTEMSVNMSSMSKNMESMAINMEDMSKNIQSMDSSTVEMKDGVNKMNKEMRLMNRMNPAKLW